MIPDIEDKVNVEDFVLENNVLKGVPRKIFDNSNIGEILLEALNSRPDHITQIEAKTEKQTTFAEMKDRSVRCALWLQKQGIESGDIVTLCTHNHLDTYVPVIATFFSGAIYNAWSHETALRPAQRLMKLFKPKIIFACESIVEILLEAAKLENVNTRIIVFGKHPGLESFSDILLTSRDKEIQTYRPQEIKDPQQTGVILLSSGSSGFPKGIEHSYKNLFNIILYFSSYSAKGVVLWYSTCYWATGLIMTLQNILLRGTKIIHANFDPENTCKVIEKYKVNFIFISPVMVNYFCKSHVLKKYKLNSLRVAKVGGSKVNTKAFVEFKNSLPNAAVIQVYGMTETLRCSLSQTENSKNNDSVGFVTLNTNVKIIDLESGKALGPNESGEICLKSPIIMNGYYKNPQTTKEAIDEEGWLHTGDKAYYEQNGEVVIIDRIKEVMKYHNHHVSPSEIEEVLLAHPDVMEAAVVPIPHEIDGERAMAFVQKVSGSKVTEEELVQLSSVLGEIKKLWGGVKFIEAMPKTATGKISKMPLKEIAKTLANNK